MSLTAGRRLSALIVNYDSGPFAVACAESLRAEWRRVGGVEGDLEVVVVDNASPDPQDVWLESLRSSGALAVQLAENLGYAGGMNRALERSSGGPEDYVAILNPDVYFLPGSLGPLLDVLEHRRDTGVVAPAAFIDPPCTMHLPKNPMPTPIWLARTCLAEVRVGGARALARRRFEAALEFWTAKEPMPVDLLSGACLFLRRETIERLGTLFDERYSLYFEDTDLCRRISALGLDLVHVPGARILHHWARSTGAGAEGRPGVDDRFRASRRAFLERFFGPAAAPFVEGAERRAGRAPPEERFRPIHPIRDLGPKAEPVSLDLGGGRPCVLEVAMAPLWILAVGILGRGTCWTPAPETWEWFFRGRYDVRILDLETGAFRAAYSFEKTTPARREPVRAEEIDRGLHV